MSSEWLFLFQASPEWFIDGAIHVDYPRELVRLCLKDVLTDREPPHQSDKAGTLLVLGQ